jgi:hypothetical protein
MKNSQATQERFVTGVRTILQSHGAQPQDLRDKYWTLFGDDGNKLFVTIHPAGFHAEVFSVFMQFEQPLEDMGNPHSGKFNYHGVTTLDEALAEFEAQFKTAIEAITVAPVIPFTQTDWGEDNVNVPAPGCYPCDVLDAAIDLPFPEKGEGYEVFASGTNTRDERPNRFVLVRLARSCGHTEEARIGFFEGVEDFEHYGTKFTGASYSINGPEGGEARLQSFRKHTCDMCSMIRHAEWTWEERLTGTSKAKHIANTEANLLRSYPSVEAVWRPLFNRFTNVKRKI